VDRRTDEERASHPVLVVGTDPGMTDWGREAGHVGKAGRSIAAWACRPGDVDTVMRWVKRRGDLKGARIARRPNVKAGDHFSIYVVNDGHPALGGE
jgi:hypothetical protein